MYVDIHILPDFCRWVPQELFLISAKYIFCFYFLTTHKRKKPKKHILAHLTHNNASFCRNLEDYGFIDKNLKCNHRNLVQLIRYGVDLGLKIRTTEVLHTRTGGP